MHARNRLLTGLLASTVICALLPVGVAANELVPGRPGRYELSSITIDATSGDCRATYETPAMGNLWMRGVDATVRVLTTPRGVHVTCRFTDMSQLIELNAEVGYTDACELVTETATLTGGWGIATSAANISERAEGGTSMVFCRFVSEPVAGAAVGASRGPGATAIPPGPRGRGPSAPAPAQRVTGSTRDESSDRSRSRGGSTRADSPSATPGKTRPNAAADREERGSHRSGPRTSDKQRGR